jgi:hypothetical protein
MWVLSFPFLEVQFEFLPDFCTFIEVYLHMFLGLPHLFHLLISLWIHSGVYTCHILCHWSFSCLLFWIIFLEFNAHHLHLRSFLGVALFCGSYIAFFFHISYLSLLGFVHLRSKFWLGVLTTNSISVQIFKMIWQEFVMEGWCGVPCHWSASTPK